MKKYTSIINIIFLSAFVLPLSSCMHMIMMGGHDSHDTMAAVKVSKEVAKGDYTLAVSIDPMTVGKEGVIALSFRSKSVTPESVAVHYMISQSSEMGSTSGHDHSGNTASKDEFKTIHQNIVMVKGTSTIVFTPTVEGNFVLSVEVEKLVNSDSSFSVEVNFMAHKKKSSGMMGMGGMWDYPVLGVLVMGTMMVGMWAIRGSIF